MDKERGSARRDTHLFTTILIEGALFSCTYIWHGVRRVQSTVLVVVEVMYAEDPSRRNGAFLRQRDYVGLPSWRRQCPDRVMPGQQHNNLYINRDTTPPI